MPDDKAPEQRERWLWSESAISRVRLHPDSEPEMLERYRTPEDNRQLTAVLNALIVREPVEPGEEPR